MSWRKRFEDGPLDPNFWLGDIDARVPALLRIGLGTILAGDALLTLPEVDTLYGRHGVWPAALADGPLASASDGTLHAVWWLGTAVLVAFALGLFARVSAALSWLFLTTVHARNTGITTGGDYLAQILCFFCIWLDSAAAFSLDARLRGKARAFVPAAPLRAMQLHLAVLYFATTRLKLRGGWLDGDGIYLGLQHLGFVRPPGAWLLHHPELYRPLSFVVLACEGAFAFFALSPLWARKARLGAVACGTIVQLGILATMRVGMFTPLMLWTCVLFLPAPARPAHAERAEHARRLALAAFSCAVVVLIAWGAFVGRRFPMPLSIVRVQTALGLVQPFDLFGATYEVQRWRAQGVDAQGHSIELLSELAPGLRSSVAWRFAPLYKLTFATQADHRAIASWLCREHERVARVPLASVALAMRARPPQRTGADAPFHDMTLFAGACPAAPR
jgi:hypothetical protein